MHKAIPAHLSPATGDRPDGMEMSGDSSESSPVGVVVGGTEAVVASTAGLVGAATSLLAGVLL